MFVDDTSKVVNTVAENTKDFANKVAEEGVVVPELFKLDEMQEEQEKEESDDDDDDSYSDSDDDEHSNDDSKADESVDVNRSHRTGKSKTGDKKQKKQYVRLL